MACRHMRRCSVVLTSREMQIKTTDATSYLTEGYHLKTWPITNVGDVIKKESLYTVDGNCKLVQSLYKAIWKAFKKLKIELPYDPAIPLLGIKLKKMKTVCIPLFIAALFTIAKVWKEPVSHQQQMNWLRSCGMCVCTHTHTRTRARALPWWLRW